ncbi:Plasmid stabilization system protein ParE [Proteiniphilum saccharofermentans]|uniref:Plasmid stabilization system protein ParE n=1 Tax=Proteiniphilum saccharofermentans TaxID=1642647 RepID=A0A1R3T2K9_9BACT|nr:type II toxin-antitoxin system RelE/ParE family toxin [Proteiniphilum saccharofermentans]SCD21350.1 Plasmid stabilization system protein ParE [Proteiniphilum saccharofermentans]
MKSGYKIRWTKHALNELGQTIRYLEKNFSEKEIKRLVQRIESTTEVIARNPKLYPKSEKKDIRRAVVLKYNTLYYRIKQDTVEILSFFSNRQNPRKRKMR